MKKNRALTALVASAVAFAAVAGCSYVIPPYDFSTPTPQVEDRGWSGIANNVTESGGKLRVDLSIVNNTGQWSAMDVGASKAKVAGQDCGTVVVGTAVFVNSGGTYLPPGFVMKGYTGGSASKPVTQPLHVECSGVSKAAGQTLSITYSYITGPFNYYVATRPVTKTMNVNLDNVATDTKYPIAEEIGSLAIVKATEKIAGINGYTVELASAKRTDEGLEFSWASVNPTSYPGRIFIGQPPVLGSDGILYGFYQSPHLNTPPITPANGEAAWTTEQAVPKDVTGLYLLVPVETQQLKYFVGHVIDITDY